MFAIVAFGKQVIVTAAFVYSVRNSSVCKMEGYTNTMTMTLALLYSVRNCIARESTDCDVWQARLASRLPRY